MQGSNLGSLLNEAEWIWQRVAALHRTQCNDQQLIKRLEGELHELKNRCHEIKKITSRLQGKRVSNSFQADLLDEILNRVASIISAPQFSQS